MINGPSPIKKLVYFETIHDITVMLYIYWLLFTLQSSLRWLSFADSKIPHSDSPRRPPARPPISDRNSVIPYLITSFVTLKGVGVGFSIVKSHL